MKYKNIIYKVIDYYLYRNYNRSDCKKVMDKLEKIGININEMINDNFMLLGLDKKHILFRLVDDYFIINNNYKFMIIDIIEHICGYINFNINVKYFDQSIIIYFINKIKKQHFIIDEDDEKLLNILLSNSASCEGSINHCLELIAKKFDVDKLSKYKKIIETLSYYYDEKNPTLESINFAKNKHYQIIMEISDEF
jgi:hypothetical protein